MLGVGLLAAANKKESAQQRHQQFQADVARELHALGLVLTHLSIGRGRSNEAFWDVSVLDGAATGWIERVSLGLDADPYDSTALARIVGQFRSSLEGMSSDRAFGRR